MSIYLPPSMQTFFPKFQAFSTWTEHVPFAYDLVAEFKPSVIVELGTYRGMSFFSFCQSMVEHDISGRCYAVDTWQGDKHTGAYGEETYQRVIEHARAEYSNHAHLLRMRFEEAADQFGESSIDLLHIDGLHTYEAITEDFETWYPKVRPGGIILIHDVFARLSDFGVWKFWEERSPQYDSFAFHQGFGLGVLNKPGGERPRGPLLNILFGNCPRDKKSLRLVYAQAARQAEIKRRFSRSQLTSENPSLTKKKRRGWCFWRQAA